MLGQVLQTIDSIQPEIEGSDPSKRSFNAQNQTSSVSVRTAPTYDNNGNTISDNGQTFVYDAWNRLVAAKSGSTTVAAYGYDALGRRISETYSGTSTTNYLYYSPQWQVIEERQNGTGTNNVSQQYVWGAAYIDQMISRDTYTSGSISSTLFVLQDANWNVTALTDSSGNVVERYLYDPYGDVTVLNANWVPVSGNVSAFGWRYLHQGGRLDPVTGWYDFRNRDYIPSEGRRPERDPMGFGGGSANLYQSYFSNPNAYSDPSGLFGVAPDAMGEKIQKAMPQQAQPAWRNLTCAEQQFHDYIFSAALPKLKTNQDIKALWAKVLDQTTLWDSSVSTKADLITSHFGASAVTFGMNQYYGHGVPLENNLRAIGQIGHETFHSLQAEEDMSLTAFLLYYVGDGANGWLFFNNAYNGNTYEIFAFAMQDTINHFAPLFNNFVQNKCDEIPNGTQDLIHQAFLDNLKNRFPGKPESYFSLTDMKTIMMNGMEGPEEIGKNGLEEVLTATEVDDTHL